MITQIKIGKIIHEESIITLEVHPDVREKLRFAKKRINNLGIGWRKSKERKVDLQLDDQNDFKQNKGSSLNKVRPISLSPTFGEQKKSPKRSSYQIYKEQQKQNKFMLQSKINDWKMREWTKQSRQRSQRQNGTFIRSKSYVNPQTIAKTNSSGIDFAKTISHFGLGIQNKDNQLGRKSRSLYIKTNGGRKKLIQNYKARIQSNPYFTMNHLLSGYTSNHPVIEKKFEAQPLVKNINKKEKIQIYKVRWSQKQQQAFENVDNFAYRPWSVKKGQSPIDLL